MPVGGNSCKLKVYKWVPKATATDEKKTEDGKDSTNLTPKNETEGTAPTNNEEVKPGENTENKERFPTAQFLQVILDKHGAEFFIRSIGIQITSERVPGYYNIPPGRSSKGSSQTTGVRQLVP